MSQPTQSTSATIPAPGAPTRSARRKQTAIDGGAALVLTVLVWPFPLARAALSPLVNVACVLVLWQLLQVVYFAITMSVWGATAGTRVMGLHVVDIDGGPPTRRQRAVWGALSGVIALARIAMPAQEGKRDAPERAAHVRLVCVPVGA
jgi:uncharacterized RDD family membrane protein YckC